MRKKIEKSTKKNYGARCILIQIKMSKKFIDTKQCSFVQSFLFVFVISFFFFIFFPGRNNYLFLKYY